MCVSTGSEKGGDVAERMFLTPSSFAFFLRRSTTRVHVQSSKNSNQFHLKDEDSISGNVWRSTSCTVSRVGNHEGTKVSVGDTTHSGASPRDDDDPVIG